MGRRGTWTIYEWVLVAALCVVIALSAITLYKAATIRMPDASVIIQIVGALNGITEALDEFLVFGGGECSVDSGVFNVESYFQALSTEYDFILRFDNVRAPTDNTDVDRTNITYYPGFYNATGSNEPVLQGNVLDHDRFKQFQAAPYTVGYFFNVSYFDVSKTSRRVPVAERNVEDRGPNNLEHRRIMAALTANKMVCHYADRTSMFVTNVYDSWVVHRLPILSTFKDHMIDHFLDIHLGSGVTHPQFIKGYFNDYLNLIAVIGTNQEARTRTLRAHLNNKCVRKYFADRILQVVDTTKTDTITYHWIKSGMHLENAVTEAIHAIVYFGPLVNAVNLVVKQEISPVTMTKGTLGYSFLKLFRLAGEGKGVVFNPPSDVVENGYPGTAPQFEVNVVREFLRLMLPDNLLVSTDTQNNCVGCAPHTQSRHIPRLIELRAEYDRAGLDTNAFPWSPAPSAPGYIKAQELYSLYDATRYNASFMASYNDIVCIDTFSSCSRQGESAALISSIESFSTSMVDGETQSPPGEYQFIPVFEHPIYAPFGLGSTRNAYESLIQYTLVKLFDTIECLHFVDACVDNPALCAVGSVHIPLAPVTTAPDSFFVYNIECPA